MDYFRSLPDEISLDIFARLPTESVLNCKLICKNWNNIVRHPSFSKIHLHHLNHLFTDSSKLSFIALSQIKREFHYFEYNENHEQSTTRVQRFRSIKSTFPLLRSTSWIVGSSNGLICFAGTYAPVCICNPITKEYVLLPRVEQDSRDRHYRDWSFGFGCVSSTNEFKVIGIYKLPEETHVEVHIYTLGGGNGWRSLGMFNSIFTSHPWNQRGIFANGALYWLEANSNMIVSFDLAEETFGERISPPPFSSLNSRRYKNMLGVVDGILYFGTWSVVGRGAECYDIWLLKKKNDKHGMTVQEEHQSLGWTKEFRIEDSNLLAIKIRSRVLTCGGGYLSISDTTASTWNSSHVDFKESLYQVFPHKNTLVSLKQLGEEDTMILSRRKTHKRRHIQNSNPKKKVHRRSY